MNAPTATFWKLRKPVWDWIEFTCKISVAGVAFVATMTEGIAKSISYVGIAVFTLVSLVAGRATKRCDDREKAIAKAAADSEKATFESFSLETIRHVLTALRSEFFVDGQEADHYKMRVTLYRFSEDDSGQRLSLFCRSGANPMSNRAWAVVGERPEQCEGVAGRIWGIGTTLFLEAQSDWDEYDSARKQAYADSTYCTVQQAELMLIRSIGFGGAVVQVAGRKWGILLVDTLLRGQLKESMVANRTSKERKEHERQKRVLERAADLLGRIITEGVA